MGKCLVNRDILVTNLHPFNLFFFFSKKKKLNWWLHHSMPFAPFHSIAIHLLPFIIWKKKMFVVDSWNMKRQQIYSHYSNNMLAQISLPAEFFTCCFHFNYLLFFFIWFWNILCSFWFYVEFLLLIFADLFGF